MRTELRFSPVLGYIGSFAPKSFTFEQPTTIELDGHIPGLNEPDPSPQNTVFPSRSLAYEQASIAFDGTTFVLTPEDELAENICVNGYQLQDQAHELQDGDVLQFGSYMRKEHRFKTDCAAKVSFRLSPGASPTDTNWAGIRQLVSDLQREQAQAQQGHQSAGRKTPFKIASSQNLTQSPGQIQIPPKASKDGFSDGSFAAVLRELRHTSAFLCSKFDAMLGPVPASESASTPSSPSPPCHRYEDLLAGLRARARIPDSSLHSGPTSPCPLSPSHGASHADSVVEERAFDSTNPKARSVHTAEVAMARIRSAMASDLPSSPGSMTLPSSASIVPLHMAVRLPLRSIVGSPPPDSQHNLPSSGLGSSHYQSCAPPLPGKAPAPASFDVALDRLRVILYHLRGPSPPYAPHSFSAIVGSGAPRVFSGGNITSATWTPVPPPTGVCCASLLQHLVGYLGCSLIAHRFGPCAWNR